MRKLMAVPAVAAVMAVGAVMTGTAAAVSTPNQVNISVASGAKTYNAKSFAASGMKAHTAPAPRTGTRPPRRRRR